MNSLFRSVRPWNCNTRRLRRRDVRLAEAVRSCVEPLERRALLSASIAVNDINADVPSHNVVVTYTDSEGVDTNTIGTDDLSVGGAKPVGVSSVSVSGSGNEVVATYVLAGPGGGWDADDNGGYAVTIPAGAVQDGLGNNMEEAAVAAFDVNIPPPPDSTPPTVNSISVGNITTAGGGTHTVTVVYADDGSGIDPGSIDTGDISVVRNGSGSSLNVVDVDVSGSGNARTATYMFQAPGGSWDDSDNGDYTVTVNAGAVTDDSFNQNGNPAASAGFNVNAPPPPDTSGPSASISAGNLTAAAASHTVSVIYADNVALNVASIDAADIDVSANGNSLAITGVQVNASGDGKSAVATYTVAGPGGDFDFNDNGTYTVRLNPGAVRDSSNNAATGSPATFTVNIPQPPPVDNTGPTASIAPIGDITAGGGTSLVVVVTYTDETAMNPASIGPSDVVVSRAGPGGDLEVVNVSSNVSGDGKTIVATYTLAAPGGSFDSADNGAYTVTVQTNQVRDAANNPSQSAGGSFSINIAPPVPVDTTGPSAVITVGSVETAGGASHAITVVYTDDTAVDVSSIGPSDLNVAAPGGGTLVVTGFSNAVSADGKQVTTTYTIAAPGGTFDSADNGTYTVSLNASGVRDAAGNGATGAPTSFTVNLVSAPPPDDQGPTAVITAPDVTAPGGSTQTVTVVYTDDGRVRANTIDVGDIVVTKGGAPLQVVGVDTTASNGGTTITAVYTLAAPGGAWDGADNGSYTITLAGGAVLDTQGNGNAVAGGSFVVAASVPDGSDPAANIAAGDVTAEGVTNQVITVTYSDDVGIDTTTIGTDDLIVSGPIGALTATTTFINISADGKSAVVTYTFSSPEGGFTFEHNGAYAVTINAGAVKDTSGKGVAAATTSFQVAVPEPTPIDPGFGAGAPVVTSFVAEAVASSDSGKVLVAGRSGNSAVLEVRNSDGSLDTTFNKNGQVVSAIDTAYFAVVAQGDKVVVAGTMGGDLVIVRYLADGRVDPSFGTGGRMVVDFGFDNDTAYALAVAPDGKLVAAGQADGNFAVARFSAEGRMDPSFAAGGMALLDLGSSTDLAGAVAVQADGKIVIAGTSGTNVVVVRLQANGQDDSAALGSASPFSGDGFLQVAGLLAREDATLADRSTALAIQSDGRILIGNHTAGGDFGVVRITSAGNVDSSFGNDGLAVADFGGDDDADAILLQPTGEILVVGTSLAGTTGSVTLAALSSSGALIEGFGEGGKLMLDSGMVNTARELHVGDLVLRAFGTRQSDGRVVVGTTNSAPQQSSASVIRRLIPPGARSQSAGDSLGTFGDVNGRNVRLVYTDDDGTRMTLSVRGGTGALFRGADGKLNLVLTDGGTGATVKIAGRGGDGRISLGDVTSNGSIKNMTVKNGDVSGTFSIAGQAGRLTLGNVTGSICSAGSIQSISVASLTNARLLAGANLGANAEFGGTGASADSFGGAFIGTLRVAGQIVGSTIGAGLDPVDATFLDEDDRVIGGATSFIKAIRAKQADEATRFLAGSFGKVSLGAKVTPATDGRFRVLPYGF